MANLRSRIKRVGFGAGVVLALSGLVVSGVAAYGGTPPAHAAVVAAPASGTLVMLVPSRIADSRAGLSLGTFRPLEREDLQIAARGGVPLTGAAGAVLNVTVVNPQRGGFVTVWPSQFAKPNTSNINFPAGQTIANNVIVKLISSDGTISIYNGSAGTVDVVVDVEGYIAA